MAKNNSMKFYTKDYEWIEKKGDVYRVGISDHAQSALGDLVFVDLPSVGDAVEKGSEFAVVESVKAASDVYAPISGEVTAVNEVLDTAPETVNQSPEEDGWICEVKASDDNPEEGLFNAEAYQAQL